jgi:hypothetical protein
VSNTANNLTLEHADENILVLLIFEVTIQKKENVEQYEIHDLGFKSMPLFWTLINHPYM